MGKKHLVILYCLKRRQTGRYILSPFLFTLYIDELSYQLNNCNLGYHISNVCVSHQFYADDLWHPVQLGCNT